MKFSGKHNQLLRRKMFFTQNAWNSRLEGEGGDPCRAMCFATITYSAVIAKNIF